MFVPSTADGAEPQRPLWARRHWSATIQVLGLCIAFPAYSVMCITQMLGNGNKGVKCINASVHKRLLFYTYKHSWKITSHCQR